MKKCIEKLKVVETNRAAIVSELKEALQEQVRTTGILPFRTCISLSLILVLCRWSYGILFVYVTQESELEKVRTQLQVMFCNHSKPWKY